MIADAESNFDNPTPVLAMNSRDFHRFLRHTNPDFMAYEPLSLCHTNRFGGNGGGLQFFETLPIQTGVEES